LKNVKFAARLAELQAAAAQKAEVTLADILTKLGETYAAAKRDKQHSALVSALVAQAKLAGSALGLGVRVGGEYPPQATNTRHQYPGRSKANAPHHRNQQPLQFQTARRCGARTRSGKACRSPATKKGRCRLHGAQGVAAARLASGMGNTATARGPTPRLRSGGNSAHC
jgi:hypothetical protein